MSFSRSVLFTLFFITLPVQAMQLNDPRAAAVYIQKQRPLINSCLQHALRSNNLTELWRAATCNQLLDQDQQLKTAWSWLLPQGSPRGLATIPYNLRQPTVDAYTEYKRLAERIAQLGR